MHGYIGDDHNPSESMKWDMHFYISKQDAAHLLLLLVVMGDPLGLDGYYVHVESMISGQRCLVWWTKDGIDTSQQSQHAILGVDYFGCVWKWQDISPKLWQCTNMEKDCIVFFLMGIMWKMMNPSLEMPVTNWISGVHSFWTSPYTVPSGNLT